ncbi:MAG: acyl-CoA dehydrogenase family protein [Candidatus Binatia bacterium]|nr:acyl-CoA dehydrogenase family protein [Candidatus Binatia bacterium]
MFDLELTEEQQLVRDTVSSFAENEIRPIARDSDESGSIPQSVVDQGFDLGLIHSALPEAQGGYGEIRSSVTGSIVAEELAWGDASIAMHLLTPRLVAYPVLDGGTDAQREKILPRFTEKFHAATAAMVEPRFDFDTNRFDTTAKRENGSYILDGHKCFVPLADESDLILVLAQEGDERAGFLVERAAQGLTVLEREQNMGFKPLSTNEVKLDGVKVSADARLGGEDGFDVERMVNLSRIGIASLAVGVARGAYEFAREYAKERTAFGVPIAQKQAIAFILAEMAIEVDASRLLTWEAAAKLDKGEDATREAYLAKRYAGNAALKIADNAVQVLGGHGYVRDFPVELWFRNARAFASFDGMTIV